MAASEVMMAPGATGMHSQELADATMGTMGGDHFLDGFTKNLDSHILGARVKPRLSEEEKLAREVARRREVDLERRQRIFDAKRRTIGLDTEALDAQRAENQQRRAQHKAEARASDRELLRTNQMLTMLELDKQNQRRELEKECKDYSLKHLNFQSRREFDLNDPAANRKAPPTRVGDEDPRLGPASMQKFSGEDLTREERIKYQQLENVNFIEQQKFEKAMLAKTDGEDMRAFADEVSTITQLRNEMEDHEVSVRRELQKTQQDANLQLAAEKARQRKLDAQLEMERNAKELEFHAKDAFLNELGNRAKHQGGATAKSSGPDMDESGEQHVGYVRGSAYKGSTRAERMMVARQQLAQAEADDSRRGYDQFEDHLFARQQEQTRKQMITMEREKARMKRAMSEQVARDNRSLHLEQKSNAKRADQLYTNEFRPEFFEQFGNSCR